MVFRAVIDGAGAVELFEEEKVGEVVGRRHGGEGETEVCAFFERLWEAVRSAQNEGKVVALVFVDFDCRRKGFGGEFWANGIKNDDNVVFRYCGIDFGYVGNNLLRHHSELLKSQSKIIPN